MSDGDVAKVVKEKMTDEYSGTWHVFTGRNFSASVTHEEDCCAYVYKGQSGLLVFKTP